MVGRVTLYDSMIWKNDSDGGHRNEAPGFSGVKDIGKDTIWWGLIPDFSIHFSDYILLILVLLISTEITL
jgi:hypothetical protein